MKLTRTAAIELFQELGFKTANKWDDARLQQKLDKIGDAVDSSTAVESETAKETLAGVLKSIEAGKKIVLDGGKKAKKVEAEEAAEEAPAEDTEASKTEKTAEKKTKKAEAEEAPAPKSEKKAKAEKVEASKPEKKEKKAKAPSGAVDACGCREGSQAAQINAAVTKKVQTLDEIAAACGLPMSRVKLHLKAMVAKGKMEQSDKGFKLASK